MFEDNGAVIKMIRKGKKSNNETCFQDTQSCARLVIRSNQLGSKIQIKYIDTKNQLADMLTRGNFTTDEWNHLLCLFNISHFSSTVCSEAMAKRVQQDSGEERVTAKSRPMMSLIARAPSTLSSSASESPVKKSYGSPWSAKADKDVQRCNPLSTMTCTQHATQGGMMTKLDFSRVESWQIDGATRCNLLGKDTRVPINFLS